MSDILYACRLDRLKSGMVTWRCGVCGRGSLGPAPGLKVKCRVCGAHVARVAGSAFAPVWAEVAVGRPRREG